MELKQELIEKALALTGKGRQQMLEFDTSITEDDDYSPDDYSDIWDYPTKFSYPKFFAYLLSPEFVKKYFLHTNKQEKQYFTEHGLADGMYHVAWYFGTAIYNYQSGNPKPLEELLSKI